MRHGVTGESPSELIAWELSDGHLLPASQRVSAVFTVTAAQLACLREFLRSLARQTAAPGCFVSPAGLLVRIVTRPLLDENGRPFGVRVASVLARTH